MSKLTKTRVLVVDDEPNLVELIGLMLKSLNVEIITARNGDTGLDQAQLETPDIIITDLMMPGDIDGFTFMEKVFEVLPDVLIVVITAYGSMNSVIRALRLGAFDFLTKPVEREEVRASIHKASQQQLIKKIEKWEQLINTGLSISRDPIYIAHELLSLISKAFGTENGLVHWLHNSSSNIFLNPNDAQLEPVFLDWAKSVDLIQGTTKNLAPKMTATYQGQSTTDFTGSIIGLPLISHNTYHCVLIFAQSQPDYFDEQDMFFLQTIFPIASLTIDNAKIYTDLSESNQRLLTLQNINALTYNAQLPINRVLRLAVEGIRQNLEYSCVLICLPKSHSEDLTIRAAAGRLDKFLHRRGDTPTRLITLSRTGQQNPIYTAYRNKTIQQAPINTLIEALAQTNAPDMAQYLEEHGTKYIISLPLWQGEDVKGILIVGHDYPDDLPSEEFALLKTLTSQLALIITNGQLYHAEQQGRREMEALYQASLVITSSMSQSEVLRAITQQLIELSYVESCLISHFDVAQKNQIISSYLEKTNTGWLEKAPPGTTYPLAKHPLIAETLTQKNLSVVYIDDPDIHPLVKQWMNEIGANVRLIIPLLIQGENIGVIELITSQKNRKFTNQVIRIAQGLANQASIALEKARLQEAEAKRIKHEMELAHRIQVSLLPHHPPQIPGLSIAARSTSARVVGGDFYRFLSLPDGKFGIVIGDVSGKGVPSALFMAVTITAIDTYIRQQTSPAQILEDLNQGLYPQMHQNGMNTGLLIAIFDLNEKIVHIANAGMIAPLTKQGDKHKWLDVSGLPIGAFNQATYFDTALSLTPNTTIILSSDGIVEAKDKSGEIFNFQRFEQSLQKSKPNADSEQFLEHIWKQINAYTKGAEPHDDMTLVIIQTKSVT